MEEATDTSPKRKEIYTYNAPWITYTMAWCRSPERKCQMAVGSYIEEYSNQFQIIELQKDESGNGKFNKLCQFEHPYPATKVMWVPPKHNLTTTDLLATTGDYLRLWNLSADNVIDMKGVLNNNKHAGKKKNYILSEFYLQSKSRNTFNVDSDNGSSFTLSLPLFIFFSFFLLQLNRILRSVNEF